MHAAHRLLEAAAFGPKHVAARADHEIRIERIARRHRRLELADRFGAGNAAPPGADRRFLGRFLILDLQPGDARRDHLLDRVMGVHRVAVAGVAIDQDRNVDRGRHVARMVNHVAHADEAVIGNAVQIGGKLRAGEEEAFIAGFLGELGEDRAEPARHRIEALAGEQLAQAAALRGDAIHGFLDHRTRPWSEGNIGRERRELTLSPCTRTIVDRNYSPL